MDFHCSSKFPFNSVTMTSLENFFHAEYCTSVRIFVIVFRGACSLRRFTGLHHAKRIWIFETPIVARLTQSGHETSPRVEISSDYVVRLDVKEARRMRRRILLEEETEERSANAASTFQNKNAQRQQLQALLLTQSDKQSERCRDTVPVLLKNQSRNSEHYCGLRRII